MAEKDVDLIDFTGRPYVVGDIVIYPAGLVLRFGQVEWADETMVLVKPLHREGFASEKRGRRDVLRADFGLELIDLHALPQNAGNRVTPRPLKPSGKKSLQPGTK